MKNKTSAGRELPIIRCVAGIALAFAVLLYAFSAKSILYPVDRVLSQNLSAVLIFLTRVWSVSTVCGLFLGIVAARAIFRVSWLARPRFAFSASGGGRRF